MKKFSIAVVAVLLTLMLIVMCACTSVPATRFMTRAQVNSLSKQFPNPQAEVTLNYTISNKKLEVKIVYDLLLSQTPLATIRFIQLANEGFYDDTVIDTYNSTNRYMVLGRYIYKESKVSEKSEMHYYQNPASVTFKGEFKSNGYREPSEGYAQFKIFSLAMYHDEWTDTNNTADTANGWLMLATANQTVNPDNYAVFAHMSSISYKIGDGDYGNSTTKVPSIIMDNLDDFTSRTSKTVYDDDSETNSESISLMSTIVTVHIKILGNYDWSTLPRIGR